MDNGKSRLYSPNLNTIYVANLHSDGRGGGKKPIHYMWKVFSFCLPFPYRDTVGESCKKSYLGEGKEASQKKCSFNLDFVHKEFPKQTNNFGTLFVNELVWNFGRKGG